MDCWTDSFAISPAAFLFIVHMLLYICYLFLHVPRDLFYFRRFKCPGELTFSKLDVSLQYYQYHL